jgi:hypothetical protein
MRSGRWRSRSPFQGSDPVRTVTQGCVVRLPAPLLTLGCHWVGLSGPSGVVVPRADQIVGVR